MAPHHFGVNMVVNTFAVLVFVVLMCAFWWFFGSREMEAAVERKASLLNSLRASLDDSETLRDAAMQMDQEVHAAAVALKERSGCSRAIRADHNRRLLYDFMGPVIGVLTGLLLGCVVYNWVRNRRGDPRALEFGHWVGLVLVFVGYLPEVLLFVFVIERYAPIGDFEILQRLCGFR